MSVFSPRPEPMTDRDIIAAGLGSAHFVLTNRHNKNGDKWDGFADAALEDIAGALDVLRRLDR